MTNRRLYRTDRNRVIAGVASGIADYFDIDPTLVRLVFIFLALANGAGILIYIIAWIIIPEEPKEVATFSAQAAERHPVGDKSDSSNQEPQNRRRLSADGRANGRQLMGLILILVGVAYLFQSIFGALVWQNVWPMILVAIGLGLVIRSVSHSTKPSEPTSDQSQPPRPAAKKTPQEPS